MRVGTPNVFMKNENATLVMVCGYLGDGMWIPYLLRCHRRPRTDTNLDLMCPGTSILAKPASL